MAWVPCPPASGIANTRTPAYLPRVTPDYLAAPESFNAGSFIIRSFHPGDGPLLTDAVNTSYEHLRTFLPWPKPNQTEEESERFARQARGRYLLAEDFSLAVTTPDNRMLLGGTGFHLREGPLMLKCAEIGMFVRQSAARQGLGTSMLCALLHWGFTEWPWERLAWRCDTLNVASQRVAIKAGMQLEGTLRSNDYRADGSRRDTLAYAAFRSEWRMPQR